MKIKLNLYSGMKAAPLAEALDFAGPDGADVAQFLNKFPLSLLKTIFLDTSVAAM